MQDFKQQQQKNSHSNRKKCIKIAFIKTLVFDTVLQSVDFKTRVYYKRLRSAMESVNFFLLLLFFLHFATEITMCYVYTFVQDDIVFIRS